MAKMNKWDRKHLNNLTAIQRQVDRVFSAAIKEAAAIGTRIGEISPDRLFSFSDYPITHKEVESLLEGLKTRLSAVIVNGVRSAWTLSNNKNDELCRQVFGDNVGKLSQAQYRRYFSTNGKALDAFLQRKENGLNLSDRVWRYTDAFKNEIELGLDVGIRSGLSAPEMSRELKQWLQHPDTLFRRVRDEHGDLQLSKNAAAFHPGQGVYRSAYMNARRLAATETNIAYRTADYERWQELDFVVGIEIVLSNNHTLLGSDGKPHDFHDICDELAGRYPKDFKFTGWHPHCRCHAVSILKTPEEMEEDNRRIMAGEDVSEGSENEVRDVPEAFNDWAERNAERAGNSFSVPYFVKDNLKYLPEGYETIYATKMPYETYSEYEAAMKYNKTHANFTPEVLKNIRDLNKALPVTQGKIMNFTEADELKGNPHYSDPDGMTEGYWENCQTCTVGYELRRRGFPVEALPNKNWEILKFYDEKKITQDDRFLNPDGSRPIPKRPLTLSDTIEAKEKYIESVTQEVGRYELYMPWKVKAGETPFAHVMIVERQKGGNLLWFDPQSGKHGASTVFNGFLKQARPVGISVLRIDDKIINLKFSERFKRVSK